MTEEIIVDEPAEEVRVDEPVEDSTADRLERIEALLTRMAEALDRRPAPKPERGPAEPKRTLNNIID